MSWKGRCDTVFGTEEEVLDWRDVKIITASLFGNKNKCCRGPRGTHTKARPAGDRQHRAVFMSLLLLFLFGLPWAGPVVIRLPPSWTNSSLGPCDSSPISVVYTCTSMSVCACVWCVLVFNDWREVKSL